MIKISFFLEKTRKNHVWLYEQRVEYFCDVKENSPKAEIFDTRCSNVDAPGVRKSRKYLLGSAIGALSLLRAPLTPNGMKINYFVNSCVTLAVTEPSLWTTAAQGTIFQFPMSPYLFERISVWYVRAILRPYLSIRVKCVLHSRKDTAIKYDNYDEDSPNIQTIGISNIS